MVAYGDRVDSLVRHLMDPTPFKEFGTMWRRVVPMPTVGAPAWRLSSRYPSSALKISALTSCRCSRRIARTKLSGSRDLRSSCISIASPFQQIRFYYPLLPRLFWISVCFSRAFCRLPKLFRGRLSDGLLSLRSEDCLGPRFRQPKLGIGQ